MKKVLSAGLLLLFFVGCVDKQSVLFINNMGLCTKSMATLHVNALEIENNAQTFNVTPEEFTIALVNALKETNCFVVSTAKVESVHALPSRNDYLLDAKVSLSQDKERSEENIFKTVEKEHLLMMITLQSRNNGNRASANAKSEIVIDKSKILGIKPESDAEGDKRTLLKNATKKVSIALSNAFIKLQ